MWRSVVIWSLSLLLASLVFVSPVLIVAGVRKANRVPATVPSPIPTSTPQDLDGNGIRNELETKECRRLGFPGWAYEQKVANLLAFDVTCAHEQTYILSDGKRHNVYMAPLKTVRLYFAADSLPPSTN